MHHSWRALDRAIQRDIERAKGTPEEQEIYQKSANTYATVGGAQAGAIVGGFIGTVIPGPGTIGGAFIGAAIGGFIGHKIVNSSKPSDPQP